VRDGTLLDAFFRTTMRAFMEAREAALEEHLSCIRGTPTTCPVSFDSAALIDGGRQSQRDCWPSTSNVAMASLRRIGVPVRLSIPPIKGAAGGA
jgi:hypothetical protein